MRIVKGPRRNAILARLMGGRSAWGVVLCVVPAAATLAACTITTDLTGLSSSGGSSGTRGATSGTSGASGTSGSSGDSGPRPGCVDKTVTKRGGTAAGTPASLAFWLRPEGALVAEDDSIAEARIAAVFQPGPLVVKRFGFALPPGAYVRGVEVEVRRRGETGIRDDSVRLVVASAPSGEDQKRPGAWDEAFETVEYGGRSDRWGLPLTAAIVSTEGFGVAFNARFDGAGNGVAEVDAIVLTVTYCE